MPICLEGGKISEHNLDTKMIVIYNIITKELGTRNSLGCAQFISGISKAPKNWNMRISFIFIYVPVIYIEVAKIFSDKRGG